MSRLVNRFSSAHGGLSPLNSVPCPASQKRTVYSAKRKAEIAIAAIKEQDTQAQIASQHEVHPTQLKSWKQQALKAIEHCFSNHHEKVEKQQQKLISNLYEQIGHLHAQLNWLKKKGTTKSQGEA